MFSLKVISYYVCVYHILNYTFLEVYNLIHMYGLCMYLNKLIFIYCSYIYLCKEFKFFNFEKMIIFFSFKNLEISGL